VGSLLTIIKISQKSNGFQRWRNFAFKTDVKEKGFKKNMK
jgi:hypothetical protein